VESSDTTTSANGWLMTGDNTTGLIIRYGVSGIPTVRERFRSLTLTARIGILAEKIIKPLFIKI